MENLEQEIRQIIAKELVKKLEEVKPESKLVDDLGADSLALIELVTVFEDKYSCSISDEDMNSLKTVSEIVNYIRKYEK